MKKPNPRSFTGKAGRKNVGANSGIFSNSGKGQKRDSLPPVSPQFGTGSGGKKADVGLLRKAVHGHNPRLGRKNRSRTVKA